MVRFLFIFCIVGNYSALGCSDLAKELKAQYSDPLVQKTAEDREWFNALLRKSWQPAQEFSVNTEDDADFEKERLVRVRESKFSFMKHFFGLRPSRRVMFNQKEDKSKE